MTAVRRIASYINQAGDIQVTVTFIPATCRYAVRVYDLDAKEALADVALFTDEEIATAYAFECAEAAILRTCRYDRT